MTTLTGLGSEVDGCWPRKDPIVTGQLRPSSGVFKGLLNKRKHIRSSLSEAQPSDAPPMDRTDDPSSMVDPSSLNQALPSGEELSMHIVSLEASTPHCQRIPESDDLEDGELMDGVESTSCSAATASSFELAVLPESLPEARSKRKLQGALETKAEQVDDTRRREEADFVPILIPLGRKKRRYDEREFCSSIAPKRRKGAMKDTPVGVACSESGDIGPSTSTADRATPARTRAKESSDFTETDVTPKNLSVQDILITEKIGGSGDCNKSSPAIIRQHDINKSLSKVAAESLQNCKASLQQGRVSHVNISKVKAIPSVPYESRRLVTLLQIKALEPLMSRADEELLDTLRTSDTIMGTCLFQTFGEYLPAALRQFCGALLNLPDYKSLDRSEPAHEEVDVGGNGILGIGAQTVNTNVDAGIPGTSAIFTNQKSHKPDAVARIKNKKPGKVGGGKTCIIPKSKLACHMGARCTKGNKCKYSHRPDAVAIPSKPCHSMLMFDNCNKTDCTYSHDPMLLKKFKTHPDLMKELPCHQWQQRGICNKGDACLFSHKCSVSETSAPLKSSLKRTGKEMLCQFFRKGQCKFMDDESQCRFSHDLSKELCAFHHLWNSCKLQAKCPYSHEEISPEALRQMKLEHEEFRRTKMEHPAQALNTADGVGGDICTEGGGLAYASAPQWLLQLGEGMFRGGAASISDVDSAKEEKSTGSTETSDNIAEKTTGGTVDTFHTDGNEFSASTNTWIGIDSDDVSSINFVFS